MLRPAVQRDKFRSLLGPRDAPRGLIPNNAIFQFRCEESSDFFVPDDQFKIDFEKDEKTKALNIDFRSNHSLFYETHVVQLPLKSQLSFSDQNFEDGIRIL